MDAAGLAVQLAQRTAEATLTLNRSSAATISWTENKRCLGSHSSIAFFKSAAGCSNQRLPAPHQLSAASGSEGRGGESDLVGSIDQRYVTCFTFAISLSESIAVPMILSLSNSAIFASDRPSRPDNISVLCCPSVGAGVRIA